MQDLADLAAEKSIIYLTNDGPKGKGAAVVFYNPEKLRVTQMPDLLQIWQDISIPKDPKDIEEYLLSVGLKYVARSHLLTHSLTHSLTHCLWLSVSCITLLDTSYCRPAIQARPKRPAAETTQKRKRRRKDLTLPPPPPGVSIG
jgi:hypothetical protein